MYYPPHEGFDNQQDAFNWAAPGPCSTSGTGLKLVVDHLVDESVDIPPEYLRSPWSEGLLTPSSYTGTSSFDSDRPYSPSSSCSVSIYSGDEAEEQDNSQDDGTFIDTLPDSNVISATATPSHRLIDLRKDDDPSLIRRVQGGFVCCLPNCTAPGETFDTEDAVKLHIRFQDASSEATRFACVCKKRFMSRAIAARHVETQNGGKKFRCFVDSCPHRFKRSDQVIAHVRAIHPEYPLAQRRRKKAKSIWGLS